MLFKSGQPTGSREVEARLRSKEEAMKPVAATLLRKLRPSYEQLKGAIEQGIGRYA